MNISGILLAFSLDFGVNVLEANIQFKPKEDMPIVILDKYRPHRPADAVCLHNRFQKSKSTIIINIDLWNSIHNWCKRELIYHELGHCYINMRHSKKNNQIMNPSAPNICWVLPNGTNWEELVEKMKRKFSSNKRG